MSLIARLRGVPPYLKFKTLARFAADTLEQRDAEIIQLRSQLVSGFYEEEVPSFRQGAPTHELQDIVTAEEVTGYVAAIQSWRKIAAEWFEKNSFLNTKCVNLEGQLKAAETKIAKLEEKWLSEQAINLRIEGELESQSQELQSMGSLLQLDVGVIKELRERVATIEAALDKEQIEHIRTGHAMGAQLQAAYQWSESQTRELLAAAQAREAEMRKHLRYYRQRYDGVDNTDPFPTDTSALDARLAEEQEKCAAYALAHGCTDMIKAIRSGRLTVTTRDELTDEVYQLGSGHGAQFKGEPHEN